MCARMLIQLSVGGIVVCMRWCACVRACMCFINDALYICKYLIIKLKVLNKNNSVDILDDYFQCYNSDLNATFTETLFFKYALATFQAIVNHKHYL